MGSRDHRFNEDQWSDSTESPQGSEYSEDRRDGPLRSNADPPWSTPAMRGLVVNMPRRFMERALQRVTHVVIWVRFTGVPMELYDNEAVEMMAAIVGGVEDVEVDTILCAKVWVNIDCPLVPGFYLRGSERRYTRIPQSYFHKYHVAWCPIGWGQPCNGFRCAIMEEGESSTVDPEMGGDRGILQVQGGQRRGVEQLESGTNHLCQSTSSRPPGSSGNHMGNREPRWVSESRSERLPNREQLHHLGELTLERMSQS
ncbi:OLC1v1000974C1 [Oldenlandia corymbosa var. corymbosa]|uniref:OLC1v1000974C1 n=1 Tax=Oldenlandia corymbosa var. corymbosa TaxID=529605 RepID=A0AAV1D7R2_OLDCO|nr:OLC1v1000974C1 [Oldenlandia corymbosa var. corymbosa]